MKHYMISDWKRVSRRTGLYKEITLYLTVEEPNLQGLVADLCKGFQQSIPGTQVGLKEVKESKVLVTVNFPYPVDEDFIDDVYSRVKQELGLRTSGYSSNPAW